MAVLAAALPFLLWVGRRKWFFWDEWDFLAQRGLHGHGTREALARLLRPHNEHWSTVPIVAYRLLFAVFGVRHYLPYQAVVVLVHLGVCAALWFVMVRAGGSAWIATALTTLFVLFGAGSQNILWAFQIGFDLSVLSGLLQMLLADHDGGFDRRDRWGLIAGFVGLVSSGMAVTMTAIVAIVLLLRRRPWKVVAAHVVPIAVTYVAWYAAFGREGERTPLGLQTVSRLPRYVLTGLSATANALVAGTRGGNTPIHLTVLWVVPLAALAVFSVQAARRGLILAGPLAAPVGLALGAIVLFVVTGIGRVTILVTQGGRPVSLGADFARQSRYLYMGAAFLLPLIGVMLTRWLASRWLRLGVVGSLCAISLAGNVRTLHVNTDNEAHTEQLLKRFILTASTIAGADSVDPATKPEPGFSPDLTIGELLAMQRTGKLPPLPETDRFTVLGAAANLFVSAGASARAPFPAAPAPTVMGPERATVGPLADGCVVVTPAGDDPRLDLAFAVPAAVRVTGLGTASVEVAYNDGAGPVYSFPVTLTVPRDGDAYIDVQRGGSALSVFVPDHPITVCGLAPTPAPPG